METEIKTRVTPFSEPLIPTGAGQDCLVVIYAPSSNQLGKRSPLASGGVRIGRGAENDVVLLSDSVSRSHARIEVRADGYHVVDLHSTNGTYVNDELVQERQLHRGDQIKIGDTILKFLSGAELESQYHETIYRMTIIDGLTGVHNKRYFVEQLDRELSRATRHGRPLTLVICDIDYFKRVGRSKIRPIHDTLNFLNLIIKTTVYMAPLRIFLPISLFLITSGFAKMICYDIVLHHFVSDISLVMLLAGIQIGIMGFLAEILCR